MALISGTTFSAKGVPKLRKNGTVFMVPESKLAAILSSYISKLYVLKFIVHFLVEKLQTQYLFN